MSTRREGWIHAVWLEKESCPICKDMIFVRETPSPQKMNDREYLKLIAKEIEARLPDNHGFILLTFAFGEPEEGHGRLFYVSNARREDAVNALKEWLIKAGAEEDWMKHLP